MKRKTPEKTTPPRKEAAIFSDLETLCISPGFIHAIAYFCFRDNLVQYKSELTTEDLAHLHTGQQLSRTEISTLIGLLVKKEIDYTLQAPEKTQEYIDKTEALLLELHHSLASAWYQDLTPEKVQAGFNPFEKGAAMREPIFYGGDSAYNFQYEDFALKKYRGDDDWLLRSKGFDIAAAVRFSTALRALLTEKQLSSIEELRSKHPNEWTLVSAFSFSASEIAVRARLSLEKTNLIISEFCIGNDDRNDHFRNLDDFNITNTKPILNLGNNNYLLLQHYSLTEAVYENPFFWMASDKSHAPEALLHRGKFTETIAFECFKRVFGARAFRNVRIEKQKGDEVSEIDVLILFGDRAIVLQAKSKRLTIEARKGNDFQLRDDFKKAIQASYDQAILCSKSLLDRSLKFKDEYGNEIALDQPVEQIFPICLVADHYPALAPQAREFLNTQESEFITTPLVTDVFALDAMTEMLQSPLFFLSYLDLRQMHGKKILYTNELVLLSTHLKRNLWIDSKYDMVSFDESLSVHLDVAMLARRAGVAGVRTPEGILTRLRGTPLGRIIKEIEASPDAGKIDLGLQILASDQESSETINQAIGYICSQSLRDGKNHDFTAAFDEGCSGLTIHSNNEPKDSATQRLLQHCMLRKYSQKAKLWFGLLLSPEDGTVRTGIALKGEWQHDPAIDDLVKEMPVGASLKSARQSMTAKKIRRNDTCPCGSGKKYKKCCLQDS